MEAETPEPDLETEFVSLAEIEVNCTAYRLAVDEGVDPKQPLGLMVRAFETTEDEPIPAILWEKYLVEPFQRKHVIAQRWNPEGSRCFYSALERDTAIAEMTHHVRKRLANLGARPATAHYVKFSIEFHGRIVDIHALISKHPELIYDHHHPNCHVVGRAALQRGSDGILAPSVRYVGGRCLAVYVQQALKPGEFLERVIFSRSPSGEVLAQRTPYRSGDRLPAKLADPRKRRPTRSPRTAPPDHLHGGPPPP